MFKAKPLKAYQNIPWSLGSSAKRYHPVCFSATSLKGLGGNLVFQITPLWGVLFFLLGIHISAFFSFIGCKHHSYLSLALVMSVIHFYLCCNVFSHFTHIFQDASVLQIWLLLCLLRHLPSYKLLLINILCQALEKTLLIHTTLELWLPAYSHVLLAKLSE